MFRDWQLLSVFLLLSTSVPVLAEAAVPDGQVQGGSLSLFTLALLGLWRQRQAKKRATQSHPEHVSEN
ncbi:MAG: GlyGly-CTERM sorting domain-containing protein [Rheinheimera sp.]|nr:MAG: GlyGly-CTERM sorting domain-containing protein [Rheinheimera sp.]